MYTGPDYTAHKVSGRSLWGISNMFDIQTSMHVYTCTWRKVRRALMLMSVWTIHRLWSKIPAKKINLANVDAFSEMPDKRPTAGFTDFKAPSN